ncbi:GNAT family N-acetyltransferase [Pseudonocardia acaciae]|uniref:GNAT family N-acetyltransferase n=1 Tax=Pseudonocardia acaciae TaxID=551276 RepID=UPI00048DDAFF|nr:GNAT family N-acetyltransferase [Pseudonocardia acaciae]
MDEAAEPEVLVRDAPDRSRFEITVDGKLAGFSEYRSRPGRIVFTHTEVDDAYQGRGLAGRLVRAALDRARRLELEVTPLCPYVANYIRRHPEYLDLVDEHHRGQLNP